MTSKELAKLLGISESAVSFALNDRPGVSQVTRMMVKKAAMEHGMDLGTRRRTKKGSNVISLISYLPRKFQETDFFRTISDSIEMAAAESGYQLERAKPTGEEELKKYLKQAETNRVSGIIVLGYLLNQNAFNFLAFCSMPILVLDNSFSSNTIDFIQINNVEAAFQATNYLINKRPVQPGYLRANIRTYDFTHREIGFYDAIRYNMMVKTGSPVIELNPAMIEYAEADMNEYLDRGEPVAPSYFADNDVIAIGVMRALKKHGYRIPEDVSIIGFDDIYISGYMEPALTTVHIPRHYMGRLAVKRLISVIEGGEHYAINIQINGYLKVRNSIAPLSGEMLAKMKDGKGLKKAEK